MQLIIRTLGVALTALSMLSTSSALAQIRIGQTTGLTGPAAGPVAEINMGAKLYLDFVNSEGGVNGQAIELVTLDDKNQVPLAAENATKLIADPRVVALFLTRGTPHAETILPLLAQGRITLIAPSTGAMSLHDPVNPWVFNVRATYQAEAEKVIRHLGMSGLDQVAILYVNDSFGTDAVQGALKVYKEAGKTPPIYLAIDKAKPDYTTAVQKIVADKSMGVLIIGTALSVAAGTKALRAAGSKAAVATLSNNAAGGFVKALAESAPGVIVSQVFPGERRLAVPLISEASRLAVAKKIPELTPAMIEGFAAAKVLVIGLKRAAKDSKEITRASLAKAMETFHRVDIGGLDVSYSSTDHTGLRFSDLSIISATGGFRR